jgi:WD40 repeat protein
MKKLMFIVVLLIVASINLFCQDYEIAWQKPLPQMSYAQFSKDGQFIYCAVGNEIWKYRSDNGEFVSKFDNTGVPYIYSMNISSSGNFIATRDGGGGSNIWDVKAEKAIRQFTDMIYTDILNDSICITIKDLGGDTRKISLNNIFSGKEVKSVNSSYWQGKIKLSHSGKMFATACEIIDAQKNKKFFLNLWDTETLTEIKRFELLGSSISTTLWEIKFSKDDKYISILRTTPDAVNYFDIEKLIPFKEVNSYKNISIAGNEFMSNGDFVYYFPNPDIGEYNLFIYDKSTQNLKQYFNAKCYNMTSSLNNLLFTAKYLIKPKTVGVAEPIQLNISITNIKDIIIIDNKSAIIENIDVKLFDMQGKEIFRNSIFLNSGINKISIPKNITNGPNIIQFSSKNINISQKILIQR